MDLGDLFEGIGSQRELSPRGQRVARAIFGGALAVLALVGAGHVARDDGSLSLRIAGAAMFLNLAAFGLFGIVFGKGARVTGCLFLLSLVGLFAVRILMGS